MKMTPDDQNQAERIWVAFLGQNRVASGRLPDVAREARRAMDGDAAAPVLIFDAITSHQVEVDFRGTPEEVVSRLTTAPATPAADLAPNEVAVPEGSSAARGPGRPKLGVVAREVTLLPRHWEWLGEQPGGASVTLRRLVEDARRGTRAEGQKRRGRESCYRFMNVMAGNEPGYEEALRALYAGERERFHALSELWPPDVRDQARQLAEPTFC